MTRDELIGRISSQELSGWLALYAVEADERKHQRDVIESGDGIVVRPSDDEDDEDDDEGDDGEQQAE